MKITIPAGEIDRWREHVRRQIASGQSRAAYCRQHGVKEGRLVYWHARLAKAGILGEPSATPKRFATVEVIPPLVAPTTRAVAGPALAPASIRIVAGGITVDCPINIDPRQLTELVRTLREA